jgi:hypothetical protein
LTKAEIGVKTGKVLNKYKVGKHFTLTIEDGRFSWQRKQEEIKEEAALDGIYVIRSSEPAEDLSADDAALYKGWPMWNRRFVRSRDWNC